MSELRRMNLLNHTVWNFDSELRANNIEIWCPDSTLETSGHRPSSPKKAHMGSSSISSSATNTPRTMKDLDMLTDQGSLIPISGEQLYDELLKMGIGMAVGKISITEMASYVHDGGGGIFTLGGKKASLEFDALIRNVRGQGKLTTYYLSMVFAAGSLAGCGLVYNNTVVIVASMLVSPLMGPILSVTFGMVLRDWPMFLEGLMTECVGLVFCIVIGLAVSAVTITESDDQNWPNSEMESRGIPHNLISGLAIAIPSGIGVATSLTDVKGSTAGLIGVAISAALLPPAVNCGLLWGYGLIGPVMYVNIEAREHLSLSLSLSLPHTHTHTVYASTHSNTLTHSYEGNDWHVQSDYIFMLGLISIVLTIMNIVCIWLVAWLTYRFFNVGTVQSKQQIFDLIKMRKVMQRVKKNQHALRGEQLRDLLQQLNDKVGVTNQNTLTFRMDTLRRGATLAGEVSRGSGSTRRNKEVDRQLPSQWINMYNQDDEERGRSLDGDGRVGRSYRATPRLFKMRSRRDVESPPSSHGLSGLNIQVGGE